MYGLKTSHELMHIDSNTRSNINKISILQILRGFAAILVVLFHFREMLIDEWPQIAQSMAHGQIGVDIFFIISGFVIYLSTKNENNRKAGSFIIRRFFRVAVPAWAAMILFLCIKPPYLNDFLLSVLFIPLKNNNPPGYGYNFLIVAWTLTYELVFYAIFSITISCNAGRKNRGALTCFFILVMVGTIQTATGIYTIDADAAGLFADQKFFPMQIISLLGNPLFFMFIVGISLAFIYEKNIFIKFHNWPHAFLIISIILIIVTIKFQYRDGHGFTNSGLLACWIVFGALIIQSLVEKSTILTRNKAINIFIYTGELSFSLYLIHPIIRSITMTTPIKNFLIENIGKTSIFFSMLIASFIASYFFYNFVEIPAQNYGKKLCNTYN